MMTHARENYDSNSQIEFKKGKLIILSKYPVCNIEKSRFI